jgi:replicative DNA helicase
VSGFVALSDAVRDHFESEKDVAASFPWGSPFLQRALGNARVGHLYTVGAYTNVGKSAFVLTLLADLPFPSAMITVEDSLVEVGRRARSLTAAQLARVCVAAPEPRLSAVLELIGQAAKRGCKVVVVDYVQELSSDAGGPQLWARSDEIRVMLSAIKRKARDVGVVPIVVSQMRRPTDPTKRPTVYDLAEGSTIEKKSEAIIILWQPPEGGLSAYLAKSKSTPVWPEVIAAFTRGPTGLLREVDSDETF